MSGLTITQVDTHRLDLRYHGRLLAYAIRDLWGWSLLQTYNGEIRQTERVDEAPEPWPLKDWVARRLVAVGNRTFPPAVQS